MPILFITCVEYIAFEIRVVVIYTGLTAYTKYTKFKVFLKSVSQAFDFDVYLVEQCFSTFFKSRNLSKISYHVVKPRLKNTVVKRSV